MNLKDNKSIFIGLLLLSIFLLPLFFINLYGYNDWGGDFAQYIHQALQVVENKAQSVQFYIFNPNYSELAPQSYAPGFPLILTPIVYFWGLNFIILQKYLIVLSFIMFFTWFIFLRTYLSTRISIISILIFAYSPYFLYFKNEILSDIPYSIFITLCLIFIEKIIKQKGNKYINLFVLIVSSIIAISIKPIGLVLIVVFIAYAFILLIKKESFISYINFTLFFTAIISFSFYKIGVPLLLESDGSTNSHFSELFLNRNYIKTILGNLEYYYVKLTSIYITRPTEFRFFNSIFLQILSLSFLGGFYFLNVKKISFYNIFFLAYLSVILIFPYRQGYRYLLPLSPIILLYMITGLQKINFLKNKKILIVSLVCFLGYVLPVRVHIVDFSKNSKKTVTYGPNSKESKQVFKFIQNKTKPEEVIVFDKPRVLGLFSERRSFSNQPKFVNIDEINKDILQFKPTYILYSKQLENKALNLFIKHNSKKLNVIFSNNQFKFYQLIY